MIADHNPEATAFKRTTIPGLAARAKLRLPLFGPLSADELAAAGRMVEVFAGGERNADDDARPARQASPIRSTSLACEHCGGPMHGGRKKFCKNACKQANYRARKSLLASPRQDYT